MKRRITLFSGQFADLSIQEFAVKTAGWGYDGVELACWGQHLNVPRMLREPGYAKQVRDILDNAGLSCSVISSHLVSQAVCDLIDDRHRRILPPSIWGDGEPEGVRRRAEDRMKDTARAAAEFGADTVVGFTGSSVFHLFTGWPPVPEEMIEAGYVNFAERWSRILDAFEECGVRFALEAMPGEIGYDAHTVGRAFDAIGNRASFGLNLDPTHLHWQLIDEPAFVQEFGHRIYHVHCKDARRTLDGRRGVLASHLPGGHLGRGWDFVSVGHGNVPFEAIIRSLDAAGYDGPLSVEWEDSGMDREVGAAEAVGYLRRLGFETSASAWSSSFTTPE